MEEIDKIIQACKSSVKLSSDNPSAINFFSLFIDTDKAKKIISPIIKDLLKAERQATIEEIKEEIDKLYGVNMSNDVLDFGICVNRDDVNKILESKRG
jgi:hypothetical protein